VAEPSDTALQLEFERRSVREVTVLVLRVRGEVDVLTAGALGDAVREGLEELARQEREDAVVQTKALLIDLREVAFIGASGLNTLITTTRDAPRRREPVRLVVDHNHAVIRPADLLGLDTVFGLYDDLDDAVTGPPLP
jgi:anti-sigma B factor antagonist